LLDVDNSRVELETGERIGFDAAVLATGLKARIPEVEGADLPGIFTLRNLSDAISIKQYIRQNAVRRVVIVGAGFIAFEMCEAFRTLGLHTTMLYRKQVPLKRLGETFALKLVDVIRARGVRFVPGADISCFEQEAGGGLRVHSGAGEYGSDLVLIAIGAAPDTGLAETTDVALGQSGAIAVNERMQTNHPFVYAVGDCCETFHRVLRKPFHLPLGDVANKQARVAGANIGGGSASFPGVIGSFCFKVFDTEVAGTGITEQEAGEADLPARAVTVRAPNRPQEYPGSEEIGLTLVAEKGSGRILGARAVGGRGTVARVNILAAAITANLDVEQLAQMDLAYAPPFSAARDVVHIAASEWKKA
jgi:NADPH-dependent 2,4-dienoyl-CoA reductase/sulfur reductase-like enzyme